MNILKAKFQEKINPRDIRGGIIEGIIVGYTSKKNGIVYAILKVGDKLRHAPIKDVTIIE